MQYRPDSEQGGSNPHTLEHFRSIDASELRPGHRLVLPDGEGTAEIIEIDTVLDDYGNPALYFTVLENHLNLRVAHGTSARIASARPSRPADLLFSGSPAASEHHDLEPQGGPRGTAGDADGPFDPAYPAIRGGAADDDGASAAAEPAEPERPGTTITLDTGDVVVVPGKARASTGGPTQAQLRLIPVYDGHPEDLIRHIDAVHPGRHAIHEMCERLVKGINTKSGACLQDLRDLAFELYVGQNDPENAQKVADLLAVVPFDGNPGRWASVEAGLALAAHLARERGEDARSAVYSELLHAPDTAETDPFRAQMAARVRQRTLNEPNLYEKEVSRAAETGDEAEERSWRVLRLATLLHLRAHGGSEAFDRAELDRRIRIELDAVRR
ncbi:DUF6707 family protein [Sinomonas susongensis]|uniref:DUF6707 family protein n=1 Tax=Sinomonas susongensis TaxID=1324851 RepID=UPI0011092089|nr:DUF6707 family protein [Sinomonas susongensis]